MAKPKDEPVEEAPVASTPTPVRPDQDNPELEENVNQPAEEPDES